MHVLLVLQQRAVQRRNDQLLLVGAQRFDRQVLDHQQLQPVQQLRGRGLLLQARDVPDLEEHVQCLSGQVLADVGIMRVHDPLHRFAIGKADVMEETPAQERVRQLLLVVRGDDHHRPVLRRDRLARLIDEELHPIEFQQQIVGEFDIRLIHLVDQHDDRLIGLERVPQFAAHDVVGDVVHPLIAQLAVAQPGDRVVLVKSLLRLGGRLDVPFDQRMTRALRHLMRQNGLAGARFALHQQRPLQRHRRIDRDLEIAGGDVSFRTL